MCVHDVSYLLREFHKANWKTCPDCLPEDGSGYVYVIVLNDLQSNFIPIYVGQCASVRTRWGDYSSAYFAAQTDYKVGTAIQHLYAQGYEIELWFKEAVNSKLEERTFIRELLVNGCSLLNSLPGYDYIVADREEQWHYVAAYCYLIVAHAVWRKQNSKPITTQHPLTRMIVSSR